MSILEKFTKSSKELTDVRVLCVCAMMLALRVVLGIFTNFTLAIVPFVKIGLSFIPTAIVGYLYGPVCAAIVSGMGDILSVILSNPSGFSITPGITVCYVFEGLIYGLVLYGTDLRIRDIAIAEGAVMLLCRLPLNTLVLSALMHMPYTELLLYRAAVLVPFSVIEGLILWAMKKPVTAVRKTGTKS